MAVYAFGKAHGDQVKIGVSTNVERRRRVLENMSGGPLILLKEVECDAPYQVERELHELYRSKRSEYGEWFELPAILHEELFADMQRLAARSPKALASSKPALDDPYLWLREPLADAFIASLLSEKELADLTGLSQKYVRDLLFGKTRLVPERVRKAAAGLNVQLAAVVSRSREATIYDSSEEVEDFLAVLKTMSKVPSKGNP